MSSIRRRITVGTLIAVSGFLAINGVTLYLVVRDRLMGERDRGLTILAHSTGAAAASELSAGPGARPAPNRRYALEGIAFSPWVGDEDPNQGATITAQEIWDRLQLIRDDSNMVRTYGVDGGLEDTGWLIHQLGKEAVIGAWIDGDAATNRHQLETLARLCREGDVDVAVIGSEVLLREDLPVEELMQLLIEARRMIPEEIPITTADTRKSFLDHPELLPLIDLVYVNYYPYWDGVSIDEAIPTLAAWHDSMREYAQGKPVVVSEAGWPSDGDDVGEAIANPENAARFFLEFVSWARLNDVRYTYFSPLDEPWKERYEGPQGAHWGYRDRDGVLKPGMQAVFDGIATDIGEPRIGFTSVPPPGSEANLVGEVSGIGTLTHHVAVLLEVGGVWYTKPSYLAPTVRISSTGRFEVDVTTGAGDRQATRYAAFLFAEDFVPAPVDSEKKIPEAYFVRAIASAEVAR